MMVAMGESDEAGGTRLILGLTNENLRRLVQGKPIHVTRTKHGDVVPLGLEILIIHGDDERVLLTRLRAAGVVGPETDVRVDPRLGNIT